MKKYFVLLIACFLVQQVFAQSAEEIITKVEAVYHDMKNYIDEGEVISFIYSNPPYVFSNDIRTTLRYVTAHDEARNVYHFMWKDDDQGGKDIYSYFKTSDKNEGIFQRLYTSKPEGMVMTIDMAGASLYAVGGGVLAHSTSLHYPELIPYPNGKSVLHQYLTATRLSDTTINESDCYVVDLLFQQKEITQAMLDNQKHYSDSIQAVTGVPSIRRGEEEPYTIIYNREYFIRKQDYLILRKEDNYQSGNNVRISSAISMNPKVNVENFEKYLVQKE